MVSQAVLKQATNRIVDKFNPQRIILFGSHARGTADERSDVDLLIVASFKGKRRTVVVEIDRTLRGIGFARDIVLLTPEEFERDRYIPGSIARPASKEGEILYERY
jgi:predicted nucleotidyltransferase